MQKYVEKKYPQYSYPHTLSTAEVIHTLDLQNPSEKCIEIYRAICYSLIVTILEAIHRQKYHGGVI